MYKKEGRPYFFTFTCIKKLNQYFYIYPSSFSICTSTCVKNVCTVATSGPG